MKNCYKEILDLLSHAPELKEYLSIHPEKLSSVSYADIIAGAPIKLTEKRHLLKQLLDNTTNKEAEECVRRYCVCLEEVLKMLEKKKTNRACFL